MGNDSSKAKGQDNPQSVGQQREQTSGKTLQDTKKVLLAHKSETSEQEIAVRHFRDALTHKANGSVKVNKTVNIAKGKDSLKDSSWLDEINHVLLFCLTSDAIPLFEQIIREEKYVQDGRLNGKVFSVIFGESLSCEWPPKGISKGSDHARDFTFNFENVDTLTPKDFEQSDKMTALVAAMRGT